MARWREQDRHRPTAPARGYGAEWFKAKAEWLREPQHRICEMCHTAPATTVHHEPPHRGDMAAFWNRATWRASCAGCHNAHTAKVDMARRPDGKWR